MSAKSLTARSEHFRRVAARIGAEALREADNERMLRLLHQALSWIALAENEELLNSSGADCIEDHFN
jgi:hypothetical protein